MVVGDIAQFSVDFFLCLFPLVFFCRGLEFKCKVAYDVPWLLGRNAIWWFRRIMWGECFFKMLYPYFLCADVACNIMYLYRECFFFQWGFPVVVFGDCS